MRLLDLEVTILDAMNYIADSWDIISLFTISNCWRRAGFVKSNDSIHPDEYQILNPEDINETWKYIDQDILYC